MENTELSNLYMAWGAIMLTVYILFKLLETRINSSSLLFIATIGPAWLVATIIKVIVYYSAENTYTLFNTRGILLVLVESLPSVLFIGGLTFFYFSQRRKRKQ